MDEPKETAKQLNEEIPQEKEEVTEEKPNNRLRPKQKQSQNQLDRLEKARKERVRLEKGKILTMEHLKKIRKRI